MAIELMKRGDTVSLTKLQPGLSQITVGLSWGDKPIFDKEQPQTVGGFLKGLLGKAESTVRTALTGDMDIDSSLLLFDDRGRYVETIYYANKRSQVAPNAIVHMGDDLTGRDKKGEYDNEEIHIDLSRIPQQITRIFVIVNIYQAHARGQNFGQTSAYTRILKRENREPLIRYDLDGDYSKATALIVGEFYRHANEWKFRAIGEGTTDGSISEVGQTIRSKFF